MSFNRLYATQSSFISKKYPSRNYGSDHLLSLFLSAAASSINECTRVLIQFPVDSYTSALTSSFNAILYLYDARNTQVTDQNFTLELYPITEQWSEGIGSALIPLSSAVSYTQRTSLNDWSTSGGTYTTSISATINFQKGTESLSANVSAFINYWKTNPNYGILIKFPSTIESTTSDYTNYKTFFSRKSHTVYRPHLDISTPEQIIKDDRKNLHLGNNTIFLIDKNVSSSSYPGGVYVKSDLTLTSGTAHILNYFSKNTWYINFNNTNLVWDGLWTVLSNTASNYSITSVVTGSIKSTFYSDNLDMINSNVIAKSQYYSNENPIFRVKLYNYIFIGMGSVAVDYYPTSAYLFFIERNTRKVSTPELELGYDKDGHFTKFQMSNLLMGYYYIPVVKIIDGINNETVYREIKESAFYVKDLQNQFG